MGVRLCNPIPLPWADLVPPPEMFRHPSGLHGQEHVARVMIFAFLLLEARRDRENAPRLWAGVYLHDLARTHDGCAPEHGGHGAARLPEFVPHFHKAGVTQADHEAIAVAVTHHSIGLELPKSHPHWLLTALLKDADGLDRVRLGDLDPAYLRLPESSALVPFAKELLLRTEGRWPEGVDYFQSLWAEAGAIWERVGGL